MDINNLLAKRVRALRKSRGYALDRLAELSGVSRSMISLIERGETSPTATVLNKLSDALDVTMASLFSDEPRKVLKSPLSNLSEQQIWTDPESGYTRRHVSPSTYSSPIDLAEVIFPPGARVTFENVLRKVPPHQQVWVIEGAMEITVGERTWSLQTGDCLAMELDKVIVFHNSTRKQARYLVAIATFSSSSRRP